VTACDEHDEWHRVDPDLLDNLERARAPELDVQQDDVRSVLHDRRDRRGPTAAFPNTGDSGQLLQLPAEPEPCHGLVVDDEDLHRAASRSGIRISTRVPGEPGPPSVLPSSTVPRGP
jgi:hypothetical protein